MCSVVRMPAPIPLQETSICFQYIYPDGIAQAPVAIWKIIQYKIPPWKTGVSRQSKVPKKRSKPPKGQVTELIHSKQLFKLLEKRSPGTAKGNQFTAGALPACVCIPLDWSFSQIPSQQK